MGRTARQAMTPAWRISPKLRIPAAVHEIRCSECRVTWRSWFLRLSGLGGYEPRISQAAITRNKIRIAAKAAEKER